MPSTLVDNLPRHQHLASVCAFVKIGEPTLTRHYQPKSTRTRFTVMYRTWILADVSIIIVSTEGHCPKQPLCSTSSPLLPPPQPLTTTDLLIVLMVLPFPESLKSWNHVHIPM